LSIKVVAKVGRIRLYSEVVEKVGQADLYASNLLVFLEDSEVKAVAEHIEVAGKLDTRIKAKLEAEQKEAKQKEAESSIKVTGKLDITIEVTSIKSKLEVEDSS
jgi:hypothetical protein